MAENQQQQIDHYDFINAPQFVDFSDLAAQDDPDADKFFETHREEDDYVIPLDINAISPTVQLLYDEKTVHYSNEANKAAMEAGLEDVKIEYYASPQQQSSVLTQPNSANSSKPLSSLYGTPLGASGLSTQSSGSFYTPTGVVEDKENQAPLSVSKTLSGSGKKLIKASTPTQSLMSRLDQLLIVSSDEEDGNNDHFNSPNQPTICQSAEEKDGPLVTPTNVPAYQPVQESIKLATPTSKSMVFQPMSVDEVTSDSDSNDECGVGSMELRSPVNNILKILEAELRKETDDEDPRCSIVVAPKVGEQVHWNPDAEETSNHFDVTVQVPKESVQEYGGMNCSYETDDLHASYHDPYEASAESTLDFYGYDHASVSVYQNRASSVGDIAKAIEIEPKTRQFETYGYNPRVGITIPKTPDVITKKESVNANGGHFNSRNACYFEIEAPKPSKSVRRVSSCSDLVALQQRSKLTASTAATRAKKVPSKGLTVPKTPDALKRSQKSHSAYNAASHESSVASTISNGPFARSKVIGIKTGPTVSERLAAARSRQPMKGNHYVSMAEALINFQKNTPDRFRSLPKGRVVPEKRSTSCDSRRRGAPSPGRSPDCTMSSRARADSFTDKRSNIPVKGPALPKKVDLKPTIPKPFNLSSGQRNRAPMVAAKEEDVVDFKFKARPAPSTAHHDNTVLLKSRPQIKVTQPMSPHFASDARLRERHLKLAQKKSPDVKQKPASRVRPSTAPHNRSHTEDHKVTVTQPFSSGFDARQKEVLRRKEEKIKHELEETKKGREFHANPVPKFNSKLPKKKPLEPTHVEPFRLKSDERGAAYQEAFKRKLEEEEQHLKEQVHFHAQPADVIYKPPFEPERPTRIIEGLHAFNLATEKRAIEREHFDEQIREKEREEEERRREEQEKLEELQRLEDLERRRQLVHKAQPFKLPRPFQPKSSGKALTIPQSPAFSALPSERRIKPHSPQTNNH